MANRYGGSYRNGNGYGNFGALQQQQPPQQQSSPPRQRRQQQIQNDDYDPYGDGYSSSNSRGGGGGGGGDGYVSTSSRDRDRDRDGRRGGVPPPRNAGRQQQGYRQYEEDDQYDDRGPPPTSSSNRRRGGQQQYQYQQQQQQSQERNQLGQVTLDRIRTEWPAMCESDCVPVQMALQLLDSSSVGRAHEYRAFQRTHAYLQDSLKNIVHDYHQGFNSSIGTFHKIQSSIQASQKKVRGLKEGLAGARTSLCKTDPELKKLYAASQQYDDLLQTLHDLDELRQVPERLEARISEKQFLTAVDVLQNALRKLRKPELDGIGALSDLRSYLANQETALMDILVEELHEHLYLKSPYCQERWQTLAKHQGGAFSGSGGSNNVNGADGNADGGANFAPFFVLLDSMDVEHAVQEDPARNPEGDTFYYITLVIESLNKLGRLEAAVDQLKQRLPVELFAVVNETVNEVDQKHPSSLRGGGGSGSGSNTYARGSSAGTGAGGSGTTSGLHIYGSRETQMRADVIYDLLWTLYGKFEAIAEGHRIFHEYVKALIRREGAGNNSVLLGSFKELWNLYQNEIRSLLHTYVTTDADLYRFNNTGAGGPGGLNGSGRGLNGIGRDAIFKFAESDAKSLEMATEYDALDGIIRAAVPGLTSNSGRKPGAADKKISVIGSAGGGSGRKSTGTLADVGQQAQQGDIHKALVEPSVFNMSLLLPPTLVFLQRLKGIVPPGSDLATSTLTSFLDNFLVNVFQPQLDETLGKLSDAVFGEADAFQPDPTWSQVARRPVFKGTTAFFSVVTAFCRMLGTIPHDQALSALIITQMMRYYDRCFSWYKALVTKTQAREQELLGSGGGITAANSGEDSDVADAKRLRVSAVLALEGGEVAKTAQELWAVDEELAAAAAAAAATTQAAAAAAATQQPPPGALTKKRKLLQREVELLIARSSANGTHLGMSDVISDRDTITSLCLLYTSMKWLSVKVGSLRHITRQDTDSSSRASLTKPDKQRWTLLNESNKAFADEALVYLPMTQETVQSFDSIVSSYEELAATALMTLHLEIRCRIAYALGVALSPEETAPYLLDQDVNEPDPQILALNGELIAYDETVVRCLRDREVEFVRTGLGRLINAYLVGNAKRVTPMNARGCGRMQLNILVLQQNLKNVEEGVDLARAANYYALFDQGPDAIVAKAKASKERMEAGGGGDENGNADREVEDNSDVFTYDELKELLELFYSEQLANPERGIENAARRQMGEKLMELGEHLWQM